MKHSGACSKIFGLSVMIFFASLSPAQSQDLFGQVDQVKRELSDLKTELNDLKEIVYALRQAVLKSATAQAAKATEQGPPGQEKAAKPTKALDDEQLTRVICETVGKFFTEAETIVRSSDPSAAEDKMNVALQKLNAGLEGYSDSHRAAKILKIYQDLAWDTYMAVNVRGTIRGNEAFIENLAKHKKKYLDTCPKY